MLDIVIFEFYIEICVKMYAVHMLKFVNNQMTICASNWSVLFLITECFGILNVEFFVLAVFKNIGFFVCNLSMIT